MKIQIRQLIEGAKEAKGLVVIIDVFRAFTTACYVMANGAEKIIPVGEADQAYKIKKENPEYLLMGERQCKMLSGFDYGNSPAQIENKNFAGKTIIQTTSAGTQGIVNALKAAEIITGSFVNAAAVAAYIKMRKPEDVTLVCMGLEGIIPADEDYYCAEYIISLLEDTDFKFHPIIADLQAGSGSKFFLAENQEWGPKRDFTLCLQPNKFNFVLRVEKKGSEMFLKKINLP